MPITIELVKAELRLVRSLAVCAQCSASMSRNRFSDTQHATSKQFPRFGCDWVVGSIIPQNSEQTRGCRMLSESRSLAHALVGVFFPHLSCSRSNSCTG